MEQNSGNLSPSDLILKMLSLLRLVTSAVVSSLSAETYKAFPAGGDFSGLYLVCIELIKMFPSEENSELTYPTFRH